ncbi:MAG: hypothetical protein ACR2PR_07375 [Pseudohongiellaceae bacterium]
MATTAKHSSYPTIGNLTLPFVLAATLAALSLLPRMQQSAVLQWSFVFAAAVLLAWQLCLLLINLQRFPKFPDYKFNIAARPQHYVQALVQLSVFLYWGYHWRPVYDHLWLLAGQIIFAYAFDILLAWSRRREYTLGFGPFPIIFSVNLFLWFRDDWFYLQFLMIAIGFMGKEYVRWNREGRSVHIFNPSAFALGLFSLILIATNTTGLTWGQEIATTLTLAPNIYTFLFLIGLVVMYFFSITLIAGMAAISLFALSAIYASLTGVPYFIDSDIPAAVFLGLHLLVTDPSTSPRTPLGRALFGLLYGFGVFILYSLLGAFGAPTFYDKLLCVPLLNLSVIAIDKAVRSIRFRARFGGKANLTHIACWIAVFALMTTLGKTDGRHTGDSLPFWEQACADGLNNACQRLLSLEATYCGDNSAWACNELGVHHRRGNIVAANEELALAYFNRACELRLAAGCLNLLDDNAVLLENPKDLDLRLLLREGGQNLMTLDTNSLYTRACEHNWAFACAGRGGL